MTAVEHAVPDLDPALAAIRANLEAERAERMARLAEIRANVEREWEAEQAEAAATMARFRQEAAKAAARKQEDLDRNRRRDERRHQGNAQAQTVVAPLPAPQHQHQAAPGHQWMTPIWEPYSHFVPIPPQYQPHYPQQVYYPPAPAQPYPQPHRWSRGARRRLTAVGFMAMLAMIGVLYLLFIAALVQLGAEKGAEMERQQAQTPATVVRP